MNSLERIEVSKLHGAFYTDAMFGGNSWSIDGKRFVCTASLTKNNGNGGADTGDYADFGKGYTGNLSTTHSS